MGREKWIEEFAAKQDERREELLQIILQSFEEREITLSSGKKSNFYLDCRKAMMDPRGQVLAGELMLFLLMRGPWVDLVGGMAVGAVPLVGSILYAAGQSDPGTTLKGLFVRKESKKHGLGKRIEGHFEPGQSIAVLEDTCTTGGSALEAVDALEAEGGKVTRALCLVDRGEGAAEAFAERGLTLEALFTRSDLPI
ncbi:MAG: orotate phosphoribosyltransferase [Myxococcota bacterium]|nr:orotate phosphoribosyltransferase [Myxococcota bacterium]